MKDNEKLNALRSHSNFNKEDYPYAAYLPFWALKKGMRVIEEDDCDAPKTIYFMCVLSEDVFKDKTEDNGTILDCYVLHKIAYASDGTVIYDRILKPCVSHDETFESFDAKFQEEVFFSSVDEAKKYGLSESDLHESNLDWFFKN